MNTYMQKLIKEQFNINDLDFSDDEQEYNTNIFNKEILDITKIVEDILNDNNIDERYIRKLNNCISVFKVKSKTQLSNIIKWYSQNYSKYSLNWLDVSGITNMSFLFYGMQYDGDISEWDVSNVTNMKYMFGFSIFNCDISKWDVSNVTDMTGMFYKSKFNHDISEWNTSNVDKFYEIFACSSLKTENRPIDLEGVYNYYYN